MSYDKIKAEISKRPAPIANRIMVEQVEGGVEITFVSPDGLAGASKIYSVEDLDSAIADVQEFF